MRLHTTGSYHALMLTGYLLNGNLVGKGIALTERSVAVGSPEDIPLGGMILKQFLHECCILPKHRGLVDVYVFVHSAKIIKDFHYAKP